MQACDTQIDLSSPTARGQPVSQPATGIGYSSGWFMGESIDIVINFNVIGYSLF